MAKKPMNKFIKFILIGGGIFVGLILLLLVAAAIIIPIKYPPEKIKAMLVDELSTATKRKVSVGTVHFSLLSGFEITDLAIPNRPGWDPRPMVSAKDISISYHLLPLLWGEVSLGEIKFNQPDILVERRGMNQFNFSDMYADASPAASTPVTESKPKASAKPKGKTKGKKKGKRQALLPKPAEEPVAFSLFASPAWADTAPVASAKSSKSSMAFSIDTVSIVHGKMIYLDETDSPQLESDLNDLNVKAKNISTTGGKTTFSIDTPVTYSKTPYQLSVNGGFRYFLSSQSLKELMVKGTINDQGFQVSGEAQSLADNFSPNMDGEASLNTLKFAGLIPKNLYSMPDGLSLTGPAKVDFHLAGTKKTGLELSGTADGTELVIQYKDMFVKTNKTTCKVDFKSINKLDQGIYDLPSFKVTYENWEVTGAFHYQAGSFSGEVHSKSLPFQGLPGMITKLKNTTVTGEGSLDATFSKVGNSPNSFKANGKVVLKGVGISLPQEPYLQDMNGTIFLDGNLVRLPALTFQSFDGTGAVGVTYALNTQAVNFGFNLKNVSAQKAVNASIDAYVTKNAANYKDMISGTMTLTYSGAFKGFSGDQMIVSSVGSGNYTIEKATVKGSQIKAINNYFKDKSDEMTFEQIAGNLGMKSKVFSYTANTTGKVGTLRETGGINAADMLYSPNMSIQCDIKKEFLDSNAIQSAVPSEIMTIAQSAEKLLDFMADDQGNVPIDVIFTGPVKDNHYSYDWERAKSNAGKKVKEAVKKAAQDTIQKGKQDLGNKLKSLFGH